MAFITEVRRRISPNLRGILFTLFIFYASGSQMPFINLAYDRRGLTETEIGILSALSAISVVIVAPVLARYADKTRRRVKLMVVGLLISGFLLAFQGLPIQFAGLIPIVILIAFFNGSLQPVSSAVTVRMSTKYGIDYGTWRLWGSFGFATAATVMGFLWQKIGLNWLFLVVGVMFMATSVFASFLEEPEPDEEEIQEASAGKPVRTDWFPRDVVVWIFLFAYFLGHFAMTPFNNYSAIYMNRLGGTESMAGMMRTASALIEIPTMYLTSKIIKRFGALSVMCVGLTVFALSWMLFSFAVEPWQLIAITAFRGIGFGSTTVAAVIYLDSRAKASQAATYQGLMTSLCFGIAPLIAGPLGGQIAERAGLSYLYQIAAWVGAASVLSLLPLFFIRNGRKSTD